MHIYVINVDKHTDRMARMHKRLTEAGLAYTRFPAVTPKDVPAIVPTPCEVFTQISPGLQACSVSHFLCWLHALRTHPTEEVLVLEDDVLFRHGWQAHLEDALKDPSWSALHLNGSTPPEVEGWTRTRHQFLVGAMVYRPRALQWLVSTYADAIALSDAMVVSLANALPVHTYFPWLCIQENYETYTRAEPMCLYSGDPLVVEDSKVMRQQVSIADYMDIHTPLLMTYCSENVLALSEPWEASAKAHGWEYVILRKPHWEGYIDKILLPIVFLRKLHPDQRVVFTDALDVIVNCGPDELAPPDDRLVIATEINPFPAQVRPWFLGAYPNSGFFYGTARSFLRVFEACADMPDVRLLANSELTDQFVFQLCVREHPDWFQLDTTQCLCMYGIPLEDLGITSTRHLVDTVTGLLPQFVHFNGGVAAGMLGLLHTACRKGLVGFTLPSNPEKPVLRPPIHAFQCEPAATSQRCQTSLEAGS